MESMATVRVDSEILSKFLEFGPSGSDVKQISGITDIKILDAKSKCRDCVGSGIDIEFLIEANGLSGPIATLEYSKTVKEIRK